MLWSRINYVLLIKARYYKEMSTGYDYSGSVSWLRDIKNTTTS